MSKVLIAEAIRTPFGKFGGKLMQYSAVELGALVSGAALQRAQVAPADVDETLGFAAQWSPPGGPTGGDIVSARIELIRRRVLSGFYSSPVMATELARPETKP